MSAGCTLHYTTGDVAATCNRFIRGLDNTVSEYKNIFTINWGACPYYSGLHTLIQFLPQLVYHMPQQVEDRHSFIRPSIPFQYTEQPSMDGGHVSEYNPITCLHNMNMYWEQASVHVVGAPVLATFGCHKGQV